jgi:hypothetical protein
VELIRQSKLVSSLESPKQINLKKSSDKKSSGAIVTKKISIRSPQVIQIKPEEFAAKLRKPSYTNASMASPK